MSNELPEYRRESSHSCPVCGGSIQGLWCEGFPAKLQAEWEDRFGPKEQDANLHTCADIFDVLVQCAVDMYSKKDLAERVVQVLWVLYSDRDGNYDLDSEWSSDTPPDVLNALPPTLVGLIAG